MENSPAQKPKDTIGVGFLDGRVILSNLGEAFTLGKCIAKTEFCPKAFKNLNEDAKAASIAIQLMMGQEMGFGILQSLTGIVVVNGVPSLMADLMLAKCQSSGLMEWHKEYYEGEKGTPGYTAVFEAKRKGAPDVYKKTFSVEDAQKAGLKGKTGPWSTHEAHMQMMKARSFCLRSAFADVLKGMHSVEEMQYSETIDVTPKSTPQVAKSSLDEHVLEPIITPNTPPPFKTLEEFQNLIDNLSFEELDAQVEGLRKSASLILSGDEYEDAINYAKGVWLEKRSSNDSN